MRHSTDGGGIMGGITFQLGSEYEFGKQRREERGTKAIHIKAGKDRDILGSAELPPTAGASDAWGLREGEKAGKVPGRQSMRDLSRSLLL